MHEYFLQEWLSYMALDNLNFPLEYHFVAINRQKHKLVYAWTPNSRLAINKALSLGVYGIVTDNVSQLHVAIKEAQHWSDAERLLQVLLYS